MAKENTNVAVEHKIISLSSHFTKGWQTAIYKPLNLLPRRLGAQDTPAWKTILCARPSIQLQKILSLATPEGK
jgi:hypothetical protein